MDLLSIIAKLGTEAAVKSAAPMMALGKSVAAGDIAGGLGDFVKSAYSPQIDFGKAMMDPNSNGFDAFMKMQSQMAANGQQRSPMQMASMSPLVETETGQMGMQNERRGLPISRGLPQGLLAQLGYQR